MGGCTKDDFVALFIGLSMPATKEQLLKADRTHGCIFHTGLGNGMIVSDGDKYRLGEKALTTLEKLTEKAEETATAWQNRVQHLKELRAAMQTAQN